MNRYHAPPPGTRSGIADYASTLLRALEDYGELPLDLYHIGNNRLHTEIYNTALERPGIVVLHDAVLHHFLLGTLSREQYINEFVYNYGAWRRDLAAELWAERGSSAVDARYFHYGMLKRLIERSKAIVVHNPGAAAMVRHQGGLSIQVIPHFFEPTEPPATRSGQTRTLFGIFGYLRETKRVLSCITAFKRLHAKRPNTALLLAGDPVSSDLSRILETEAAHPAIHRVGHLSDRDLLAAAASVDCCLNLRYPGAGETSGIAIRLMGLGKPVILTDSVENSEIPVHAALRVKPGIAETAELFDHMVIVNEFPQTARDIGAAARRHILEHHSLEVVARKYWQVLCDAA